MSRLTMMRTRSSLDVEAQRTIAGYYMRQEPSNLYYEPSGYLLETDLDDLALLSPGSRLNGQPIS